MERTQGTKCLWNQTRANRLDAGKAQICDSLPDLTYISSDDKKNCKGYLSISLAGDNIAELVTEWQYFGTMAKIHTSPNIRQLVVRAQLRVPGITGKL